MESLAERILFSEGGSFLVTGYRGVGKTSFINQVIRQLEEALPWAESFLGATEIIDIYLNLARPVQPSELMHHIIRRLHDRLIEKGIYHLLDQELKDALTLAYYRTSVNMARKLAESSERSFGFNEASIGGEWMKAAVKMSWNSKRSRTQNYEMSFLGYDDKSAEHDIISISRNLAVGYIKPITRWDYLKLAFNRFQPKRVRLKTVFVFDELDKLEELTPKGEEEQKPVIDGILGALKNLFATSGITFVFIAGKDLQERWLEDVGKGDSIYESVFSYDKYLPCLWTDVDSICDELVDVSQLSTSYKNQIFREFKKYLAYKGRGIPRRIIRTFNEYVEWDDEQPVLAFTRQSIRKIRFFAGLQQILTTNEKQLFGDSHEEVVGTQSDKRRLGVYYLIDWILRQGPAEFTLKDVLNASKRLSVKIALAEEIATNVAERIIQILRDADYIQESQRTNYRVIIGDANAIGDASALDEERYKIAPRRLGEMGGIEADVKVDMSPTLPWPSDGREGAITSIGKYRIVRKIGQGGMGTVYEATDKNDGRKIAIKVMMDNTNAELLARFEREAMIMGKLNHPNIVKLYDCGTANDQLYIAMEYLDGITLDEAISRQGKLDLNLVIAIAKPIAEAAHYIHQKGFVRNDIKPNNIMLTSMGRVCLLDFGISRPADSKIELESMYDTRVSMIIGTPQFMAPEQFQYRTADARSDIYSLGVVLYKMLTGVTPIDSSEFGDLVQAHIDKSLTPPSQHVDLPAAIDKVVMRCLEKDPNRRFQTMEELAEALSKVGSDLPLVDLKAAVRVLQVEVNEIKKMDQMHTVEPAYTIALDAQMAPSDGAPPSSTVYARPALATPEQVTEAPGCISVTNEGAMPLERLYETGEFAPHETSPHLTLRKGRIEDIDFHITAWKAHYPLKKKTSIGRNSENDIVLRDENVSRYHAEITTEGEDWFIEDFNSNIGTAVNGEKLIVHRLLKNRDEIQIGEFTFVFNQADVAD